MQMIAVAPIQCMIRIGRGWAGRGGWPWAMGATTSRLAARLLWALPNSLLAGLAAEAAACFYIDCWVFLDRRLYAIGSDGDRICGHHAVVAHRGDEDNRCPFQLGCLP